MSGNFKQSWVTYAGNDKEAWKVLLLGRALKSVVSTRNVIAVLDEDGVSRKLERLLQAVGITMFWAKIEEFPPIKFASIAKILLERLRSRNGKLVFLDCNNLPLKNIDDLFHQEGVEFRGEVVSVLATSNTLSTDERKKLIRHVVEMENPEVFGKGKKGQDKVELKELNYSVLVDWNKDHPTPLPTSETKLVSFLNGHPIESEPKANGFLEQELEKITISLLPEKYPSRVDVAPYPKPPEELTNSVAIVGMSCRYPCANNLDEFWNLLEKGLEGCTRVPPGRWSTKLALVRDENMVNTQAGFLACPVDTFDQSLFEQDAATLPFLDPQQRLSMRLVWEALEHAGIDPLSIKGSMTGVFGGWWRNDYKEMIQMSKNEGHGNTNFDRSYTVNGLGTMVARISTFFGLKGPSFSTESGCSTSIAGVDMACSSLRGETADLAIAVGANLLLHPFSPGMLEGVLALDGRCKTYDISGDGFGRAEGIGCLVLKRFSSALSDGDPIWGVIRGAAIVQEGPSKSMGTPTVDVEAKAMQLAMERAGVSPNEVEFLETHGTGTPVGDPIEVAAVAKAYRHPYMARTSPLIIASGKTNIGHTESVCGIAGIQKTLLQMKYELIAKHLHVKEMNPEVNLEAIPAILPLNSIPWKKRKGGKPRIAGVNSFGITGAQANVILQEPPDVVERKLLFQDKRKEKIFTFSGKTEGALQAQLNQYKELLESGVLPGSNWDLGDLEYGMHVARAHIPSKHRRAVIASEKAELVKKIDEILENFGLNESINEDSIKRKKICLIFPDGMESTMSSMFGIGKGLYDESVLFRSTFDWANSVFTKEFGLPCMKALIMEKEEKELLPFQQEMVHFTLQFGLAKILESWGIEVTTSVGFGMGEILAARQKGQISEEQAVRIAGKRAQLLSQVGTKDYLQMEVEATESELARHFKLWGKKLEIIQTKEKEILLLGPKEEIHSFKTYFENNVLRARILKQQPSGANSSLIAKKLPEFARLLEQLSLPNTERWVKSLGEKLDLAASLKSVRNGDSPKNKILIEVSPCPVLSPQSVTFGTLISCGQSWSSLLSLLRSLYHEGVTPNWKNFHLYSGKNRRILRPFLDLLPNYPFQETSYWMPLKDDGSVPFHPLLGGYVPNPSGLTLFKSSVNVHKLPFLKDHALGDKIIFPCVGYVDMILTAGFAAQTCREGEFAFPKKAICVRNFSIATPVCLSEMQPTEFQVVVSKDRREGTIYTKLNIEQEENQSGEYSAKWVTNARGTFSLEPPPPTEAVSIPFATIKERCSELASASLDYTELEEFGFFFGPSCRTVHCAWRNPNDHFEWLFPFTCHEKAEDQERFIIHPWCTDPMLQTQIVASGLIHRKAERKRLVVPVAIDNFTWWGVSEGEGYVYIRNQPDGRNEAHLFTKDGRLMVSMVGVEFMDTTLSNILALIDSHKNPYPDMAEYLWKERMGPEDRRVTDEQRGEVDLSLLKEECKVYHEIVGTEAQDYEIEKELAGLHILKAMRELGLQEKGPGTREWDWKELAEQLGVRPNLSKFLRYLLLELEQDGWIKIEGNKNDRFKLKVLKKFPEVAEIQGKIAEKVGHLKEAKPFMPLVSSTVWSALSQILIGAVDALPLLFPEGTGVQGPAELYYTQSLFASKRHQMSDQVDLELLSKLGLVQGQKNVVRILEVGAGIGSSTVHLIRHMSAVGPSHFEYTFTDISPSFLQKGEQLFEEAGILANFQLLNVENCPLAQGFPPEQFDVIVASWVLHATKDLATCLRNLKTLLKPNGTLLVTELTVPTRPINLLYGGLDGFWRFEDTDLRPWNCELGIAGWETLLSEEGFKDIVSFPVIYGTNALITAKKGDEAVVKEVKSKGKWIVVQNEKGHHIKVPETMGKKLVRLGYSVERIYLESLGQDEELEAKLADKLSEIFKSEEAQLLGLLYFPGLETAETPEESNSQLRSICEPFLYISKFLVKNPLKMGKDAGNFRVLAFTQGQMCTSPTDFALIPPEAAGLIGMVNVLANENQDLVCKTVDLDLSNPSVSLEEAFTELFSLGDPDTMIAYRKGHRFTPRLKPYKVKGAALPIPRTPRFKLILPKSHLIQDLQFAPSESEIPELGPNEVEVEVKAYALNFLDVLMVTKPDPVFEKYNYLGVDISGVISRIGCSVTKRKVGDRVVMIRRKGEAMPSHLTCPEYRTLILSDDITFEEASTFPMGMLTAASCMVDTAKAKKGDIILIHTASGGVGLIAIQIARMLGCEIVVTAGNERKRNYLRNLGIKYVFNSRSTNFENEVREALGGRGVDIVLNSLTGEGFKEATLNLCDPGARFIEMSKMNIWSVDEVKKLRPDVFYAVVDISSHTERKITELSDYLQEQLLVKEVEARAKPLPYVRYDASEVRDALEFMEKVKHIGKIVLTMPVLGKGNEWTFPLFTDRSTYLITGGCGGLGLEVAKWMAGNGAKTLLLLGRREPSGEVLDKIEAIRALGVKVETRRVDVGNSEHMKALEHELLKAETFPPLRGIIHAAGLLEDGTFDHQNWTKYEAVFQGKIRGAWNLHRLTTKLLFPLEHFVLFSSVTATVGAHGQSNYVAGNQYLDCLVHYRHSIGLPGCSINWGQWGQVGLAANMNVPFNKPMTIHQGLAALEHALKSHKTQVVAHETDFPAVKQVLASTRGLLRDIEEASGKGQNDIDGEEFWQEYDVATDREAKYQVVRKFLKKLIKITLKLDKNEEVEDHVNFQDMGMDSLMMVEMKNGLQASVGKRVKISINSVKDCKTLAQLSDRLVELISGKEDQTKLSDEELGALISQDATLPGDVEVTPEIEGTLTPIEEVSSILVTGSTGMLGPYVLRELFKNPKVKKIFILMQQTPLQSPEERFKKVFENKGLLKEVDMSRIEFLTGNVKDPKFGLKPETYKRVSLEIEAVVHLAVKVAFDEYYRATEDPKSSRVINVNGMREVISFTTAGRLKHLLHTSTFAAVANVDAVTGRLSEYFPREEEAFMLTKSAYPISKLICDRLAEQAISRGVPVKVLRLPQIGGDSVVGGNIQMESFLMMRFLAYLYIGSMPGSGVPLSLMAVDQCAKLIADIFWDPKAGYEMYNVLNPSVADETKFPILAKEEFGINVEILESEAFAEKWKQIDSKDEMIELVKFTLSYDKQLLGLRDQELPYYTKWREGNQDVFLSRKLEQLYPSSYPSSIIPSWEVLRRDLQFAKKSGVFDRFKIKC